MSTETSAVIPTIARRYVGTEEYLSTARGFRCAAGTLIAERDPHGVPCSGLAALAGMAVARTSGQGDVRVPCPLCGGLLHPIAGRCKHCKADLSTYRGSRPQANAPLPALANGSPPHAAPPPARAAVPVPMPMPVGDRESQPVLPPRPTGRSMPAQSSGGVLRHWPVVVIVLAVIAIAAAVILMVWPKHDGDPGKTGMLPPAPEHMNTSPFAPGDLSPSQPQVIPRPPPTPPQIDPPRPPPPSDTQLIDPDDFGGAPNGSPNTHLPALPPGDNNFGMTVLKHACARLLTCPGGSVLRQSCDMVHDLPDMPIPTNCPSAKQCVDAIDHLSCTDNLDFTNAMTLPVCLQALQC